MLSGNWTLASFGNRAVLAGSAICIAGFLSVGACRTQAQALKTYVFDEAHPPHGCRILMEQFYQSQSRR